MSGRRCVLVDRLPPRKPRGPFDTPRDVYAVPVLGDAPPWRLTLADRLGAL